MHSVQHVTINLVVLKLQSVEGLKLKLLHSKLKLTRANNIVSQLVHLLNHVSQDMDTIEHQLHSLVHPHSSIITDSSCLSHMSLSSSPVDPSVSSPAFPNIIPINNLGFLDEQQPWTHPRSDPASVAFQSLVEGKALPEKGKLVQSVMEAGPLLQNLLDAGPLPTWRHPPPSEPTNVVPPRGFADPNGVSVSCSDSAMNFVGNPSGSWSNTLRFTPNASVVKDRASKHQRIY